MKTFFLKSILPVAVALGGAFGTMSFEKSDDSALAPQFGWFSTTSANACDVRINCDDRPVGPLCTAIHNGIPVQAFGKVTPTSSTCTKILRMPLN